MRIPSGVTDAAAALRSGELTSTALTQGLLARIDRENEGLGAVLGRCDDAALQAAACADRELAAGTDRGALHGIPLALKDILATADAPTTGGSLAVLPGFQGYDSAAAERLRIAGAVLVAKATTSEFACGTPDETKPFLVPRNPWDTSRWAGGSSAGTGSGVSAGFFMGGVGSDTGGSIRVPAAFCGVTGLKPTFGLVSRFGCIPLSATLDHVGPMARSAEDCAHILTALAGPDSRDAGSVACEQEDYAAALNPDLSGVTVGVDRDHYRDADVPEEIVAAYEAAVSELAILGATVVEVSLPFFREIAAATTVVMNSEPLQVHGANLRERWSDYGRSTRLRLATGAFYSASDYTRAQAVLRRGRVLLREFFQSVDCVVTITSAAAAWRFEEIGLAAAMKTPFFTNRWNGLGMPAMAVPMGFSSTVTGSTTAPLPLSWQIAGPPHSDGLLLRVAAGYQTRTDWHSRTPPGFDLEEPLSA